MARDGQPEYERELDKIAASVGVTEAQDRLEEDNYPYTTGEGRFEWGI